MVEERFANFLVDRITVKLTDMGNVLDESTLPLCNEVLLHVAELRGVLEQTYSQLQSKPRKRGGSE